MKASRRMLFGLLAAAPIAGVAAGSASIMPGGVTFVDMGEWKAPAHWPAIPSDAGERYRRTAEIIDKVWEGLGNIYDGDAS